MSMSNSDMSRSEKSGLSRMENEGGPPPTQRSNEADRDEELAALGIACVQTNTFEWGGYRYTNARDAIAAAKRGATV